MTEHFKLRLQPVESCQLIKAIKFAPQIKFNKLLIIGPPGSGKTTLCNRLAGWPQEGYIDLSYSGWWKTTHLALRPREIHLGIPFIGHKEALAVFETEWLDNFDQLQLDFQRLCVPPSKRFALSVNWYARYNFEFILPDPEILLQGRQQRAKSGSHYVDKQLDLKQIKRQIELYAEIAKYFHDAGLTVHVRSSLETPPCRIITAMNDSSDGSSA